MAGEIVTKSKRFYCVSIFPDICLTPIGLTMVPVPYVIIGEFSEATGVSPDITSNGDPVVIHASTMVPSVRGDEAGIGKGIKSGTVGGRVQAMEKSSTLSFNGERAVRVGDLVYMNDKNTIGKVFERLDASALKAFPKACGPGGTLAVLTEALDACNFIPCALLNLVPGCPVPAVAGEARRGNNTDVQQGPATTIGKDGGVSRGRYSDAATQDAIKAFNAEMLEYTANQEGQPPEYVWADDRVYPARPLTVQDVSNSAYENARALTSTEGWAAVGKTVMAFGGQHESSTSAAAAAVGQNRVPMERPTQAELRQAATTLSAVPGLVQYELEFLGAISPVSGARKPRYPDGVNFSHKIPAHLNGPDGFSQKTGISGTHNLDEFKLVAAQNHVRIVSQTPGAAPGISNIEYQIPARNSTGNIVIDKNGLPAFKSELFKKTVYDPAVYPTGTMLKLGQQAAANGYHSALANGVKAYNSTAGGIPFRVYIEPETGLVTNFHPR